MYIDIKIHLSVHIKEAVCNVASHWTANRHILQVTMSPPSVKYRGWTANLATAHSAYIWMQMEFIVYKLLT